jgi:hypothetical protein
MAQLQINGTTRCTHFDVGRCIYGQECIKQHGAKDVRPLCGGCTVVRVKEVSVLCSRCVAAATEEEEEAVEEYHEDELLPCEQQCDHHQRGECKYGEMCVKDHNDGRELCPECEKKFVPSWAEGCRDCTRWPASACLCFSKTDRVPNTDATCEFGIDCFRMHGYQDPRPCCTECYQVRVRPGRPLCRQCNRK